MPCGILDWVASPGLPQPGCGEPPSSRQRGQAACKQPMPAGEPADKHRARVPAAAGGRAHLAGLRGVHHNCCHLSFGWNGVAARQVSWGATRRLKSSLNDSAECTCETRRPLGTLELRCPSGREADPAGGCLPAMHATAVGRACFVQTATERGIAYPMTEPPGRRGRRRLAMHCSSRAGRRAAALVLAALRAWA